MILSTLYDYALLCVSLVLVVLEGLATAVTLLLPSQFVDFITNILHFVLPRSATELALEDCPTLYEQVKKVSDAESFVEICTIHGYKATEHIITTPDGYLLGVHRLCPSETLERRGVVYLHHGLLMNSEIWVANPNSKDSIALRLVDAGYEVWLGNNRGNKYSKKHTVRSPMSREFWNFCIDEFAMYDIPATVDYILKYSGAPSLAYIGFSQGSAQAFAALSVHPDLNKKINLFIALGPAMAPPSVGPRILQTLVTASPSLLYGLFGHRIILRSTVFWQSIMLPKLFIYMIDLSNRLLFKWRSKDISWAQKCTGYLHLYSYTSVKCVVHWFQIIARNNGMHMYDDDTFGILGSRLGAPGKFYQVLPYPTANITTPIEIIYGTNDTLVNIDSLLAKLPKPAGVYPIEGYEHLEMVWGRKVPSIILPRILSILQNQSWPQIDVELIEPSLPTDTSSLKSANSNYLPAVSPSRMADESTLKEPTFAIKQ